ncbi:hypothetical protein F5Y04DRAFT_281636 [Hypomontagnella monticulosa]|nr:hypothetical protein F5Y04DRAFT_281636 [Hypomontagnella monticulosa]
MQLTSILAMAAVALHQGLYVSAAFIVHAPDEDGNYVSKRGAVYEGYCTKSNDPVAHGYCTFESPSGKDETMVCDGSWDCTRTDAWCAWSPDGPVKVNCS